MAIKQTIKLDLIPKYSGKMPSLHASQYDDGRDYHIDLTENRVPYTLDGTETISLTVRKCDNTLVTMDIANTFADKSYIEFRTTEQMNACAGFNYGEITIEKNGTQISSLNFYLQVEGAPDEGGITSQSEINNLERQVHDAVVEELKDNGASETGYDNTESGLEATNVQDAIDEVNTKVDNIPSVDAYTKEQSDEKYATKTELSSKANVSDIPTKTSQLQNDSGFAEIDDTQASASKSYSSNKVNGLLGNKASASEVENIRIGADGSTYASAGDAVRGQVSDLNNALSLVAYGQKIFSNFVSGARSTANPNIISSTSTRVTSANVFKLKAGDKIEILGTFDGIKYAIAGKASTNYDSGWKTDAFSYIARYEGTYFVNCAKSDGTSTITPEDATISIKISDNSSNGNRALSETDDLHREIGNKTIYDFGVEIGGIYLGNNDISTIRSRTKGYIHAKYGDKISFSGSNEYAVVYYAVVYYDVNYSYISTTNWLYGDLIFTSEDVQNLAYIRIIARTPNNDTITNELMHELMSSLLYSPENRLSDIEDFNPESILISKACEKVLGNYGCEIGTIYNGFDDTSTTRCRTVDYIPFVKGKIFNVSPHYASAVCYDAHKRYLGTTGFKALDFDVNISGTSYIRIVFRAYDNSTITTQNMESIIIQFSISREINEECFASDYVLPSYFATEVDDTVGKLESYCNEKALVFAVVTDSHLFNGNVRKTNWKDTISNICSVNAKYPIDALIHLGDSVNGDLPKVDTFALLKGVRDDLIKISDCNFMLLGNHDINSFYDNMSQPISEAEFYSVCERYNERYVTKRPNALPYWYKDYDEFGIRVIYLSASMGDGTHGGQAENWGYPLEELSWVENVALDTNNQVLFFSHMPMSEGYISSDNSLPQNGNSLKTIVNNFINNGGVVVGLVNGHTHFDYKHNNGNFIELSLGADVNTGNTVNKVGHEIASFAPSTAIMYGRTNGTLTQDLWSLIVVRPTSRTCKMIRFGAGDDTTWTY